MMLNDVRIPQAHDKAFIQHVEAIIPLLPLMNEGFAIAAASQKHIAPQGMRGADISIRDPDFIPAGSTLMNLL